MYNGNIEVEERPLLLVTALLMKIYPFFHPCAFESLFLCLVLSRFTIMYIIRILFITPYCCTFGTCGPCVMIFFINLEHSLSLSFLTCFCFNFLSFFFLWVSNFTFGRIFCCLTCIFNFFFYLFLKTFILLCLWIFHFVFPSSLFYLPSTEYLILLLFLLTKMFVSFMVSYCLSKFFIFYLSVPTIFNYFKVYVSYLHCIEHLGFACGLVGKESACNAGDLGSSPGLGRSPGEGKGYPLQDSGLENSMDCIVHGVTKSRTWLSNFHFHFHWTFMAFLLYIISLIFQSHFTALFHTWLFSTECWMLCLFFFF